ncbi:hypothetical protein AWM75_07590 [Aerococcus urinaehominis]|uniref:Uncharacterized protein n=1 Tax=Aerococcus urinaehominis TaxID=128944 RepID=A0A120IB15_9LACT|nr:dsDNA nuclease domain-containing protein [Aerococcus urinaehominis]AMB99834.1 hypothetical protein AWM75_07590 [Aerococcus urinaehominis]SDM55878.1 protein of unknown function [Aerococcus urinaehominis]
MSYSDYYMNLPLDLAGSRTKNRFRVELLWGISKLIDAHEKDGDYTLIFDFKCDIELHYEDGVEFYQVKTMSRGNYNLKKLTNRTGNSNSILGKLYALYTPSEKVKLAVVCNKYLKVGKNEDLRSEVCLGELNKESLKLIKQKLIEELDIKDVSLENTFYICDGTDLNKPHHALLGKLVESFEKIKHEEPNNPNALYRLVSETAQQKACYEENITTYEDVKKLKGISRAEFDKMLESHRKKSLTGIELTRKYISGLPVNERRRYNMALTDLLNNEHSHDLRNLEVSIFDYILSNEDLIIDEDSLISNLSAEFDKEFTVEYSQEFKHIVYLKIFYIYVEGGDVY